MSNQRAAKKEPPSLAKTRSGSRSRTQSSKSKQPASSAAQSAAVTTPKKRGRAPKMQKILFAMSEVSPFVTTGGMGMVGGSLPVALERISERMDVRVVAPYYAHIRLQFGSAMEFMGSIQVYLAWRTVYCGVYTAEREGITYYFLDNEDYFDRENCYGYFDDGERFAFFSKAVLSILDFIHFVPDVIHAHDWQTALVPIYLKTQYTEQYPKVRSVFTIHNIEYQGKYALSCLSDVFGLSEMDRGLVEFDGCINLMKGAIICADRFTTVSPSYAEEIRKEGGYGLEPIIRMNVAKLRGIINGIDTEIYNPESDPSIYQMYNIDTVETKAANKRDLQLLFGLPVEPRTPLLCMVTRLVAHKGIDLLITITPELIRDKVQLLILGTGEHHYELFFRELAIHHPDQVAVNIAFNPEIERRIYAGADIMMMPSRNEPCGLANMVACRYGTVPVVRATGGLKDTVRDCRLGDGNGFVFEDYDPERLLFTVRQAVDLYTYHQDHWHNLVVEAMRSDVSWDRSAKDYAKLYAELM